MIELTDLIKIVVGVLAVLLLAGMLGLVVMLYKKTKTLQNALNVSDEDTTSSDFSGITVTPAVDTSSYYYSPSRGYYDARYPYGDTFNYDPRYTYDPRYPYEPRYTYNPPRYYPTYDSYGYRTGGYYYPPTFPNSTTTTTN